MALTGRFNFRRSLFGKLVLEVEEEAKPFFGGDKKPVKHRWRRATLIDLAQPEMRALIDLRFQPQYVARTTRAFDISAIGAPPANATSRDELPSVLTPLPRSDTSNPQRISH